jgi:hypothetical protein
VHKKGAQNKKCAIALFSRTGALGALLLKSTAAKLCAIPDFLVPFFWRYPFKEKSAHCLAWHVLQWSVLTLMLLVALQRCFLFLILLLSGGTSNLA